MAETIGQQLKKIRETRNLSIQKVVQVTRIRAYQIEAIESDDLESIPSPIQARAYLRIYAEFLGVHLDGLIEVQQKSSIELDSMANPEGSIQESQPTSNQQPVVGKSFDSEERQGFFSRLAGIFTSHRKEDVKKDSEEKEVEESVDGVPSTQEPHGTILEVGEESASRQIFEDVGSQLRSRRELLGISLDEIEKQIHLPNHYLEAMEVGAMEQLPSSVQARGMLANYSRFLNLDVDAILTSFAEGLQEKYSEEHASKGESQPPALDQEGKKSRKRFILPASIRRFLTIDLFAGGGLVILLLAFSIWGMNRIISLRQGSTPQPTVPAIANILVATLETTDITSTSTQPAAGYIPPQPSAVTADMTLPAASSSPVQVVVIARQQAWVKVTADGKIQFEGRMAAGDANSFEAKDQIEVLTGDGYSISILYNQNDLGPMGNLGEVVDRIYTSSAILIPTSTHTPTPTITNTPTITPRPTNTIRPSPTTRP
jgi:cytoskeleton protein RodZ